MPQLVFQDFAPQLVWLAVVFFLLYLVIARRAVPRIGLLLEMRSDKIAADLDAAARLKRETENALKAYEAALDGARSQALAIVAQTRQQLAAEANQHKDELKQTLDKRITEAEARIAAAKAAAMANVRDMSVEAAGTIAARLLGHAPDTGSVAASVDSALAVRS